MDAVTPASFDSSSAHPGSARTRSKSSLVDASVATPIAARRFNMTSASPGRPLRLCARASIAINAGIVFRTRVQGFPGQIVEGVVVLPARGFERELAAGFPVLAIGCGGLRQRERPHGQQRSGNRCDHVDTRRIKRAAPEKTAGPRASGADAPPGTNRAGVSLVDRGTCSRDPRSFPGAATICLSSPKSSQTSSHVSHESITTLPGP